MADPIRQDELDRLLKQTPSDAPQPATADAGVSAPSGDVAGLLNPGTATSQSVAPKHDASNTPGSIESGMASGDIELLLRQAEQALQSIDQPASGNVPPGVKPFRFEELGGASPSQEVATLELLRDVELDLKIELGRTHMYLEDVLKLRKGSVVPLDKLAGDPVDIYVNGRLIARGEVLVLNDNFCVRVAELVAGEGAAAG